MKVRQISTTVEIDDLERAITASAETTTDALRRLLKAGSGIHFLAQLKFEKAGRACVVRLRRALDRAAEACDAAVMLDAHNVDAQVFRGLVLHALGRSVEARACYEGALQLDPQCAHAHVFLAESLLLGGDVAQGWSEVAASQPLVAPRDG